jgi:hypothetical protein
MLRREVAKMKTASRHSVRRPMSVVPRRFSTFLSRSKWPLTDRVADEYTHLSAGAKPRNCDGTRSRTPYDAGVVIVAGSATLQEESRHG